MVKKNIYEWRCFLFIGFVVFLVLSSMMQVLMLLGYSVFVIAPWVMMFSGILLYAYDRFAGLYTGGKPRPDGKADAAGGRGVNGCLPDLYCTVREQ